MVLALSSYNYPILDVFWAILIVFLWVLWFWVLITVFVDLFRSRDLSGWAKAFLRDRGVITADEFDREKAEILA